MSAVITWNCVADDESCDNCLALDGQEFTPDTLPGWPGDGSFGNDVLCEGGPRCRCTLTYSDSSGNVATGTSGLAEAWNAGALASGGLGRAGQIAQWTAGQNAFIDSLPDVVMPNEVYSAQARAAMRLQVRQQIAQQLGVNPADVSASAVAAQVPAIYKAMKPSMRIVHDLLDKSYPEKAIEWIGQMDWGFRKSVPLEDISVTGPSSESDAKSIRKKVKKMRKGKPVKPLILIDPGDGGLLQVADGHHRCAAALEADLTEVPAYVGKPHTDDDWRKEVMDMQMVRAKKGALNMFSGVKNFSASMGFAPFDLSGPEVPVKFAGLLLMARNTGRVLMIQRYLEEDDPAAGQWEFPGGHLEGDEEALEGAMREWREEVGSELPPMRIVGRWLSPNGYMGFFAVCSSESDVDIHSRDIVNPDDPDQDNPEAVAWFYPGDLASMPGLRKETRDFTPWSRIIGKAVQAA